MIWGKESEGTLTRQEIAQPNAIFHTDKDIIFETFSAPEFNPKAENPGAPQDAGNATGTVREAPRIPPSRLKAIKNYFTQGAD